VKQTSIILLLSLLLFPIIWNGISLFHYVVEHSHTFCLSETEHSHPSPDDCVSIFQLTNSQNQNQLPTTTKSEYQELKQYISPNLELSPMLLLSYQSTNFNHLAFLDYLFSKDVFLPPIFA